MRPLIHSGVALFVVCLANKLIENYVVAVFIAHPGARILIGRVEKPDDREPGCVHSGDINYIAPFDGPDAENRHEQNSRALPRRIS